MGRRDDRSRRRRREKGRDRECMRVCIVSISSIFIFSLSFFLSFFLSSLSLSCSPRVCVCLYVFVPPWGGVRTTVGRGSRQAIQSLSYKRAAVGHQAEYSLGIVCINWSVEGKRKRFKGTSLQSNTPLVKSVVEIHLVDIIFREEEPHRGYKGVILSPTNIDTIIGVISRRSRSNATTS